MPYCQQLLHVLLIISLALQPVSSFSPLSFGSILSVLDQFLLAFTPPVGLEGQSVMH